MVQNQQITIEKQENYNPVQHSNFFMDSNLDEVVQYSSDSYIINLNINQWTSDVKEFLENFQDEEKELKI